MDLTYSEQFKKYIKEQNYLGYPQTIYKFPNRYGASVIKFNYMYFGIEIAVLKFDKEGNWDIDYSTPITNDVIGGLNEEERDDVLQQIFDEANPGAFELLKHYGYGSLPVVVIDDEFDNPDKAWSGFQIDKLESLME